MKTNFTHCMSVENLEGYQIEEMYALDQSSTYLLTKVNSINNNNTMVTRNRTQVSVMKFTWDDGEYRTDRVEMHEYIKLKCSKSI